MEAAALQGEVPMVTTVGPAVGDLSGVVNSDVAAAPVASADVEVLIIAHKMKDMLFCLHERCCIALPKDQHGGEQKDVFSFYPYC